MLIALDNGARVPGSMDRASLRYALWMRPARKRKRRLLYGWVDILTCYAWIWRIIEAPAGNISGSSSIVSVSETPCCIAPLLSCRLAGEENTHQNHWVVNFVF
ncbi:hypothetical protein KM043_006327 [Ampulex compressa]|nr:hypothetical protein KM043_006327 [Ampulex compressa]